MRNFEFTDAIDRIIREQGKSYREAFLAAKKAYPEAFRAYLDADGGKIRKYGEDVSLIAERIMAEKKISFPEAMQVIKEEKSETWSRYTKGEN